MNINELFSNVAEFPDPAAQIRLANLVGIDEIKRQVIAEAMLLLDPSTVEKWSIKYHGEVFRAVDEVKQRTPLLVFDGDVGTGKTELAETFADAVARTMRIDVTLYSLSLSNRGKGAVGEMTSLLTSAFAEVSSTASKARDQNGQVRRGVVLLVDEADALAQSRELTQMHHEDRAGVNALIRGIDQLRNDQLPVLTLLCTNRIGALDPAVLRRAAGVFQFARPNDVLRRQLLEALLQGIGVSDLEMDKLVSLTSATASRAYGCSYSDLRQRLVPQAVLDAMSSDVPLTGKLLIEHAETFEPTRPFGTIDDAG